MKIGILQAGRSPDELIADFGDYDQMCGDLIREDGDEVRYYPVLDGVFPNDPTECEAWLITGSRFGVYEDHAWIAPLEAFIRVAYDKGVRMAGICFGHQIIAQAMGGKVIKHDNGFGTGAMAYDWQQDNGPTRPISLYAWHQDQIVEKPADASVIASSAFCEMAALKYDDRILSVQAHPEFPKGFVAGLVNTRGKAYLSAEQSAATLDGLDTPIQADIVGRQLRDFIHGR